MYGHRCAYSVIVDVVASSLVSLAKLRLYSAYLVLSWWNRDGAFTPAKNDKFGQLFASYGEIVTVGPP
jgi:hypothetical protein